MSNYKKTVCLKAFGEVMSWKEWSRWSEVPVYIIKARLKAGWTPEKALTTAYNQRSKPSLCWSCQNAAGGCNWSAYCIGLSDDPIVPGWEAEEKHKSNLIDHVSFKDGGLVYRVISCPEFIPDE